VAARRGVSAWRGRRHGLQRGDIALEELGGHGEVVLVELAEPVVLLVAAQRPIRAVSRAVHGRRHRAHRGRGGGLKAAAALGGAIHCARTPTARPARG